MKLASIFFKASASIFTACRKDTKKRARNMKLASVFFKAPTRYMKASVAFGPFGRRTSFDDANAG